MQKEEIQTRIKEIETAMEAPDFWSVPAKAQSLIKELQDLKDAAEGAGKYDKGNAIMMLVAGAGGDDAEDFAHMLLEMYRKFSKKKGGVCACCTKTKTTTAAFAMSRLK